MADITEIFTVKLTALQQHCVNRALEDKWSELRRAYEACPTQHEWQRGQIQQQMDMIKTTRDEVLRGRNYLNAGSL